MSLRFKFALIILGLQCLLALFFGVSVLHQDHEHAEQALLQEAAEGLDLLSGFASDGLAAEDERALDRICRALADNDAVLSVSVLDFRGQPLARAGKSREPAASDLIEDLKAPGVDRPLIRERTPLPKGFLHLEGHIFEIGLPIPGAARPAGFLITTVWTGLHNQTVLSRRWHIFEIVAVGIALSALLGLLVDRRLGRILHELSIITRGYAGGDLSRRVCLETGDEFEELGDAFNRMADGLQRSQEQLREANDLLEDRVRERSEELQAANTRLLHSAKLASLGELAGGIAHEINTPVANIAGRASCILEDLEDDAVDPQQLQNDLERIRSNANRASEIVRRLLLFGRTSERMFADVNVNDLVREGLQLLEGPLARNRQVVLNFIPCETIPLIRADRARLTQVLVNLVTNASDVSPPAGVVTIRVEADGDGESVSIAVADQGPGIPTELQQQVFEPFFTTKSAGEGTGLGLSISHEIVQEHGGDISIENCREGGCLIGVRLPVEQRDRRRKGREQG